MIRLGVNVDHVATLRQVRGGSTSYPDLSYFVHEAVRGGADQITIHVREDFRHIQLSDLKLLVKTCPVRLNLEMAATEKAVRWARAHRPSWACFVPENRRELTTEGGLDVVRHRRRIQGHSENLQSLGIEISLFIEPSLDQVEAAAKVRADAVEFHTGHWVLLQGPRKKKEFERLCTAARRAHELGLSVHAGHGLDFDHTKKICEVPFLQEVNIGHFLVCDALRNGFYSSVREMKKLLKKYSP